MSGIGLLAFASWAAFGAIVVIIYLRLLTARRGTLRPRKPSHWQSRIPRPRRAESGPGEPPQPRNRDKKAGERRRIKL